MAMGEVAMNGMSNGLERSPPESEAEQVDQIERDNWPPEDGQAVALLQQGWWDQWRHHSSFSGNSGDGKCSGNNEQKSVMAAPGSIDNSSLLQQRAASGEYSTHLREGLREGKDFTVVSLPVWQFLWEKYGGGPSVLRVSHRCSNGEDTKAGVVDLYAMCFTVYYESSRKGYLGPKHVSIQKEATLGDLKAECCQLFKVEEVDVELFDYWHNLKGANLESKPKTMQLAALDTIIADTELLNNQGILLSDKVDNECSPKGLAPILLQSGSSDRLANSVGSPECTTPPTYTPLWMTPAARLGAQDIVTSSVGPRPRGLAGLGNLGNTCFMNSALQCLAHTLPIIHHFVGGSYRAALNRSNVLGRGGKLAEAFGSLMDKLWQGDVQSVSPRAFKTAMTGFAPQFSGYSQQDSQELLAFLLDGLHEDLNRVQKRRFIQDGDYEGQPDDEWAAEALRNYRANNDSIIDDHFQGMYRSTLDCPDCHFKCVKFDKMTSVCLEVARAEDRVCPVTVVLVKADGSAPPVKHVVQVPQDGTVADVKAELAMLCGIEKAAVGKLLLLVKTGNAFVTKFFSNDDEAASDIIGTTYHPNNLLAIQYPHAEAGPLSKAGKAVHIHHMQKSQYNIRKPIGLPPMVVWLPAAEADQSFAKAHTRPLPNGTCNSYGAQAAAHELVLPQDCAVAAAVEASLRPLKRLKGSDGRPVAADCDSIAAAGLLPGVSTVAAESHQEPQGGSTPDMPPSLRSDATPASTPNADNYCNALPESNGVGEPQGKQAATLTTTSPNAIAGRGVNGYRRLSSSSGGSSGGGSGHFSGSERDDVAEPMSLGSPRQPSRLQQPVTPPALSEATLERTSSGKEAERNAAVWGDEMHSDATQPASKDNPEAAKSDDSPAAELLPSDCGMESSKQVVDSPDYARLAPAAAAGAAAHSRAEAVRAAAMKADAGRLSTAPNLQSFDLWPTADQDQNPLRPQAGEQQLKASGAADGPGASQPAQQAQQEVQDTEPRRHASANAGVVNGCRSDAAATAGNDTSSQIAPSPLYELKRMKGSYGDVQWSQTELEDASKVEDVWHVAVDYSPHAASQLDLSVVTSPTEAPSVAAAARRKREGPPPINLTACIEAHLQPEQLQKDNEWYCPRCKAHVAAMKKLDLWDVPEVLVVHLKRFGVSRVARNKIDTLVNFPLEGLDLSRHLLASQEKAPVYDLYAVSNHFGGMGGGHYTAFARLPTDNGRWYCFDDSLASEVAKDNIVSSAAYLLFYRRRHESDTEPDSKVMAALPPPDLAAATDINGEREDSMLYPLTADAEEGTAIARDAQKHDVLNRIDITAAVPEEVAEITCDSYSADMGVLPGSLHPPSPEAWQDYSAGGGPAEAAAVLRWEQASRPSKADSEVSMDAGGRTSSDEDMFHADDGTTSFPRQRPLDRNGSSDHGYQPLSPYDIS